MNSIILWSSVCLHSTIMSHFCCYICLNMNNTLDRETLTKKSHQYCPVCCLIRSGALGGMAGTAAGGSTMALISGYQVLNKSLTPSKGIQSILIAAIGTGIGFAATFTGYAFGSHRWRSLNVDSFNLIGATSAASGAMATSLYCGYLWSDLVKDQSPRHAKIFQTGLLASSAAFIVGGAAVKSFYQYLVLKRKVGLICIPDLLESTMGKQ